MHVKYESYDNILNEQSGFGEKIINELIDNVTEQVTQYCLDRQSYYSKKYKIDIEINYDLLRANQAIIDALEDLVRLKEFHPVQYPNRLKCAAYLAYWWLQRQPLMFSVPVDKQEEFLKTAEKEDISRLIHTNAFWLVAYVLGELFTSTERECASNEEFQKQWDIELDYLFYFFCYRASSPKSIEAFLSAAVLHPLWIVKEGVYFEG